MERTGENMKISKYVLWNLKVQGTVGQLKMLLIKNISNIPMYTVAQSVHISTGSNKSPL